MSSLVSGARDRIRRPGVKKFIKYSAVSVIALAVTSGVQFTMLYAFHVRAGVSAVIASTTAAVPSYILNRSWVWGKSGRSHWMKEVVPFWVMAAIGLGISTLVSILAGNAARDVSHLARTMIVTGSSILSFGVLWIIKYVVLNKILFAHREEELEPALDGRSGLPT